LILPCDDARRTLANEQFVTATIPNDYGTVAAYLLGAMNHMKRLHLVATV
jgi:hypothetical protein